MIIRNKYDYFVLFCRKEQKKRYKTMGKTARKARKRDDVAQVVAKIHGVSPRYVNMVRDGERENEEILATAVEYTIGKNQLIKTLERLVPITPKPEKYARGKN